MCERVRYKITEPLLGALYCHCKRCQRRTGSAFSVTAAMAPGSFKIVQGAEFIGSWRPPDGWGSSALNAVASSIRRRATGATQRPNGSA